jgi:plasmid stabilization system protein ParE
MARLPPGKPPKHFTTAACRLRPCLIADGAGTREFVIAPSILVYRIKADAVEILRIYHSAQDWP